MSSILLSPSRRSFLATAAAASATGVLPAELLAATATATDKVNTMNPERNPSLSHPRS